jgi:ribose/xylose/arabinose/galactoside ABC-type transport system permease subunit
MLKNKTTDKRLGLKRGGTTFSLVLVYIAMCVVFTIMSPYFLRVKNFTNILVYMSITGVMAAGVTVAMLLGAMDISQYAVATLSSVIAATIIVHGGSLFAAILVAILTGVAMGAFNGLCFAVLRIPAIVVTLGTMQIFRGMAYLFAGGATIMISSKSYDVIGKAYIGKYFPVCVLILIAVFAIIWLMLMRSKFGRLIYAVGGNENASYLSGINVALVKFMAMVICGATAAIAGLITSSQVSAAIPSNGVGNEMPVLSGVILGGISLNGGKGHISGTIIGSLILATIQNGMTLLSISTFYQMIINGSVLILAVLIDVIRSGALRKN